MKVFDPLGDLISSVEKLPVEPSDLQVVNSARVSMGKESTEMTDADVKLIRYLAKHNHWTPFSHSQYLIERKMNIPRFIEWTQASADEQFVRVVIDYNEKEVRFYERGSLYAFLKHSIVTDSMVIRNGVSVKAFQDAFDPKPDPHFEDDWTDMLSDPANNWWTQVLMKPFPTWHNLDQLQVAQFRIKMPIFVARQWYKHQIGFTRNEISRRYVDTTPEFFVPHEWRLRADNVKQGSSDEIHEFSGDMQGYIADATYGVQTKYNEIITEENICPEQARSVLPQSMYTEFIETGSIDAYNRLIGLRTDSHAQLEVQKYAESVKKLLTNGQK